MTFIHSLNGTIFICTGELAVIYCLSNSFSSRYSNYFLEHSQAFIFFYGAVYFSNVKISSDPIWQTHFLSAYFRAPVTLKQTYYQNKHISRAESIIMK